MEIKYYYHLYVAEKVVRKPERAETPFAAPLKRDPRADELKLVKDQSFRRLAWLIPLIFVFCIVVVVFLAYNKMCQLFASTAVSNLK